MFMHFILYSSIYPASAKHLQSSPLRSVIAGLHLKLEMLILRNGWS